MILKFCEALKKNKANISLVIPYISKSGIQNIFDFYGVKTSFNIIPLPLFRLETKRYITSRINSLFPFLSLLIILFKKPDVLYVRDPSLLYILSKLKKKFPFLFKNRLLVAEVHELVSDIVPKHIRKEQHKREYFSYSTADKIVAMTNNLKRIMIERFSISTNKILVAHDGTDLTIYKPFDKKASRQKLDIPLDKNIVVYTGHLYNWKGTKTLAEAVKNLDNTILYIVGGSEKDRSDFINFIRRRGIKNVTLPGFVRPTLIPYYTASADVLVLPNTGKVNVAKYYTSPLKLFEYMAAKRPIIASDIPNLREILRHNVSALLVKPDDPEAFAKAIKKLLKNKALGKRLAKEAYKNVKKYTWYNRAKSVLRFLLSTSLYNNHAAG